MAFDAGQPEEPERDEENEPHRLGFNIGVELGQNGASLADGVAETEGLCKACAVIGFVIGAVDAIDLEAIEEGDRRYLLELLTSRLSKKAPDS